MHRQKRGSSYIARTTSNRVSLSSNISGDNNRDSPLNAQARAAGANNRAPTSAATIAATTTTRVRADRNGDANAAPRLGSPTYASPVVLARDVAMLRLSLELLRLFSEGKLPGTAVQKLAQAAWEDGWGRDDPLAERLVNAGSRGARTGHVQRDLSSAICSTQRRWLASPTPRLSCTSSRRLGQMASPAKCVSCFLMSNTLNVANKSTLEASAYLRRSWAATQELGRSCQTGRNMTTSNWARSPPTCRRLACTAMVSSTPRRYELAAPSPSMSPPTTTWQGLRPRELVGMCSRCFGRMGVVSVAARAGTQKVFEVFAWSMGRLCSGVAPSCRHDGSPWSQEDRKHRLASGSRVPKAALIQTRGDWEWIALLIRLRHYSA